MRTIDISREAVLTAARQLPPDRAIVMLNMLRYREHADYGSRKNIEPCSGKDAYYQRYAPVPTNFIQAAGGRVFWLGTVMAIVVAPPDEKWDDILLVEYPSFAVLQRLFDNPDYQAVVFHRTAALEDSRLIATVTADGIG